MDNTWTPGLCGRETGTRTRGRRDSVASVSMTIANDNMAGLGGIGDTGARTNVFAFRPMTLFDRP